MKQKDVDIEAEAARLIALLPTGLQAAAPQPLAESQPPDLPLKAEHLQRTLETHHSLADEALACARRCRFGASMEEEDEDQFVDDDQDAPGYVWNMRLAEEEQEDANGDGLFSPPPAAAAASKELVDLKEVASFLRDGRKGPSIQRCKSRSSLRLSASANLAHHCIDRMGLREPTRLDGSQAAFLEHDFLAKSSWEPGSALTVPVSA